MSLSSGVFLASGHPIVVAQECAPLCAQPPLHRGFNGDSSCRYPIIRSLFPEERSNPARRVLPTSHTLENFTTLRGSHPGYSPVLSPVVCHCARQCSYWVLVGGAAWRMVYPGWYREAGTPCCIYSLPWWVGSRDLPPSIPPTMVGIPPPWYIPPWVYLSPKGFPLV